MEEEQKHKIRFSIDICSIKNNRFYGKVFVICKEQEQLNKKQFRTYPLIDLMKISSTEQNFDNGFFTFEKCCSQDQLFNLLDNESFEFDIYHQDRNKNQLLVGKTKVGLKQLKELPFKKTEYSFVKLYDSFHKIEDIDVTSQNNKIGELRIKIYLEDLGQNESDKFDEDLQQQIQEDIFINQTHFQNTEEFTLEQLEMKVVWELETWKKSEEQKFLLQIKKREIEMLNEIQLKMNERQKEQQKAFNNYEAKLFQIEQQLRAKTADLQRREFQIKNFETMMKEKVKIFAEEQLKIKKEIQFTKDKYEDQIKDLKQKIQQKTKQITQQDKKIEEKNNLIGNLKDQLNDSPTTYLKKEIELKDCEIKNLQSKIDKYILLKKEYQVYIKEQQVEIDKLKKDNEILKNFQIANQNKNISQGSNIFKQLKNELQQLQINQSEIQNIDKNNELQNLIKQKEDFILLGLTDEDIAIQEIDKEISKMKNNLINN